MQIRRYVTLTIIVIALNGLVLALLAFGFNLMSKSDFSLEEEQWCQRWAVASLLLLVLNVASLVLHRRRGPWQVFRWLSVATNIIVGGFAFWSAFWAEIPTGPGPLLFLSGVSAITLWRLIWPQRLKHTV